MNRQLDCVQIRCGCPIGFASDHAWLVCLLMNFASVFLKKSIFLTVVFSTQEEDAGASAYGISSLLAFDDSLWVGTTDGYMLQYDVRIHKPANVPTTTPQASPDMRRKTRSRSPRGLAYLQPDGLSFSPGRDHSPAKEKKSPSKKKGKHGTAERPKVDSGPFKPLCIDNIRNREWVTVEQNNWTNNKRGRRKKCSGSGTERRGSGPVTVTEAQDTELRHVMSERALSSMDSPEDLTLTLYMRQQQLRQTSTDKSEPDKLSDSSYRLQSSDGESPRCPRRPAVPLVKVDAIHSPVSLKSFPSDTETASFALGPAPPPSLWGTRKKRGLPPQETRVKGEGSPMSSRQSLLWEETVVPSVNVTASDPKDIASDSYSTVGEKQHASPKHLLRPFSLPGLINCSTDDNQSDETSATDCPSERFRPPRHSRSSSAASTPSLPDVANPQRHHLYLQASIKLTDKPVKCLCLIK